MNPALDLFYFMMFGAGILAPVLMGLVWLAVKLLKVQSAALRRGLYQGAILTALLIAFAAYEVLMKAR